MIYGFAIAVLLAFTGGFLAGMIFEAARGPDNYDG